MDIARRAYVSIITNICKSFLTYITGLLLARNLGPIEYGKFSFLLASFIAVKSLIDMGTSNAFFSFISKELKPRKFYVFYFIWLIFQFTISFILLYILIPDNWISYLWNGETRSDVVLAFLAVFMQQQVWSTISNLAESQRYTIKLQKLNISISLIHLFMVLLFIKLNILYLSSIYLLIFTEYVIVIIISYYIFPLKYKNESVYLSKIIKNYKYYCLPLIPYTILSVISVFIDTWLLQKYGGSVEQAYYAVALQFSALSVLATVSITRIIWKEVSELSHNKKYKEIEYIYKKTCQFTFTFAVVISSFLIPWSEEIILITLGLDYITGKYVLSIMLFYPIYQSIGQVNGTMFYSLEHTKPYVKIGIIQMIVSLITTYLLLAPSTNKIPGLGLGSIGLALKMVIVQYVFVSIMASWIFKKYDWKNDSKLSLIEFAIILSISYFSFYISNLLFENANFIFKFLITGAVYISSIILYLKFPIRLYINKKLILSTVAVYQKYIKI